MKIMNENVLINILITRSPGNGLPIGDDIQH